jgi:hypothetical protein
VPVATPLSGQAAIINALPTLTQGELSPPFTPTPAVGQSAAETEGDQP